MEEQNAIVIRNENYAVERAEPGEVLAGLMAVHDLMAKAMKKGEDYGTVPGCGDKPTLLQPGAQKLGMLFRLNPDYVIQQTNLDRGHREYSVTCRLTNMRGDFVGSGVGSCCTMETKYRYRNENTHRQVPGEYWKDRDQALLGGPTFMPRKGKDGWVIYQQVEHPNPADYYNTALKMAKKRAYVDAILTRTGASQVFTQDIEDLPVAHETDDTPPAVAPARPTPTSPKPPASPSNETLPPSETNGDVPPRALTDKIGLQVEQMSLDELGAVTMNSKKHSGVPLSELNDNTLEWYGENWGAKPFKGKWDENSLFLRAACRRYLELKG